MAPVPLRVVVSGEYFNAESIPVRRHFDSFQFLDAPPADDARQP